MDATLTLAQHAHRGSVPTMEDTERLRTENRKLRSELLHVRRRLAEWTLLADLITRISTTLDTHEIGTALIDIAWQFTGAECVVLWYHPRPDSPAWTHLAGPDSGLDWWEARPSRRAPAVAAAVEGKQVVWRDGMDHLDGLDQVSSYMALPLQVGTTTVAVLEVYEIPVAERCAEYMESLQPALPPVSLALRNAQLYRMVNEQNELLEARVAQRTAQLERQQEEDTALFCHLSGFSPVLYRRLLQVFPELDDSRTSAGENAEATR